MDFTSLTTDQILELGKPAKEFELVSTQNAEAKLHRVAHVEIRPNNV